MDRMWADVMGPTWTGDIMGTQGLGTIGTTGGLLGTTGTMSPWIPRIDVRETPDNFIVHAELPGARREDINLEVRNNTLVISGETKHERRDEKENFRMKERSYGRFERYLQLPTGVTPNMLRANFENGILEVLVPKPEEYKRIGQQQTHKIAIAPSSYGTSMQPGMGTSPGYQSGVTSGMGSTTYQTVSTPGMGTTGYQSGTTSGMGTTGYQSGTTSGLGTTGYQSGTTSGMGTGSYGQAQTRY
jgi:HSP20 family protein